MNSSVRVGVLLLLTTAVAAAMLAACSARPIEQPTSRVDETAQAASGAVAQAPRLPQAIPDAARATCRPVGALGAANPTEPGPFLATFTAETSAPLGVCGASDWDIQIHSRSPDTWTSLDPMNAQHGSDCSAPPAEHELHGDHNAAVFLCRDHLMTALRADAYGVIYLTPNQLVDLRGGPVTISFDLSTERMSVRDWIDLWLTPWDENLAVPLEASDPDLQGPPKDSIQVTTNPAENSPILLTTRDRVRREYTPGWSVPSMGEGVAPGTNQAATRQRFQLTVGNGRARFERMASATAPALTFWDELVDFPFETAVLQLGHHSYTPTKDNAGVPATWHWDNVAISRAVPFDMERSIERFADERDDTVTFERGAGADSWLRFSAIGKPEVSFDDGRSWVEARRQDGLGQLEGDHHPEHFSSYWMEIPKGVASLRIRFESDDWYSGPWFAEGFAIWSR